MEKHIKQTQAEQQAEKEKLRVNALIGASVDAAEVQDRIDVEDRQKGKDYSVRTGCKWSAFNNVLSRDLTARGGRGRMGASLYNYSFNQSTRGILIKQGFSIVCSTSTVKWYCSECRICRRPPIS